MFKDAFKYYKSKREIPDLNSVTDLDNHLEKVCRRTPFHISENEQKEIQELGLISPAAWNVYELQDHPGLIIVQNPFTCEGSRAWIRRCLSEYPGPPNKCNLHIHHLLDADENWWEACQENPERKKALQNKLRWVTLGYHHDWDSKVYSENEKSKMPEEVVRLVRCLGKVIGNWDVNAEAAILNFYRMDSTLCGHTDHSEPNNTAPLFSLSFGQSAIFLIGGRTLEDKATPILIRSGDIVVMSGESRLCYHGVPRIIKTELPFDEDQYSYFLNDARINLNIRQVLYPNQKNL